MTPIKPVPDVKRFARYQSVINVLLAEEYFHKSDIYKGLNDEKPQFIGRVIGESEARISWIILGADESLAVSGF